MTFQKLVWSPWRLGTRMLFHKTFRSPYINHMLLRHYFCRIILFYDVFFRNEICYIKSFQKSKVASICVSSTEHQKSFMISIFDSILSNKASSVIGWRSYKSGQWWPIFCVGLNNLIGQLTCDWFHLDCLTEGTQNSPWKYIEILFCTFWLHFILASCVMVYGDVYYIFFISCIHNVSVISWRPFDCLDL